MKKNLTFVSVPADNWWCFLDESVFTRMVDMYKSIVVFLLTGGKTLLVPVFYENYFDATLRLLEKLHKVIPHLHLNVITCFCKQIHQSVLGLRGLKRKSVDLLCTCDTCCS